MEKIVENMTDRSIVKKKKIVNSKNIFDKIELDKDQAGKHRYKVYSESFKARAIDLVKNDSNDINYLSQYLNVPVKNLLRWVKNGPDRKKGGWLISWSQVDEPVT